MEKGTVDGSGEEATAEQAREAGAPTMEPDVSAVLERVAVMRSRGEYEQAISFLRQTLAGDLRPTTRERLEFELGSILTYQIRDRTRACEYWRKQRASNPSGRYDVEAFKAAEALGCQSQ